MTTLEIDVGDLHVRAVEFTATELVVTLADGRKIATPLDWYPRLKGASAKEHANFEIMPNGHPLAGARRGSGHRGYAERPAGIGRAPDCDQRMRSRRSCTWGPPTTPEPGCGFTMSAAPRLQPNLLPSCEHHDGQSDATSALPRAGQMQIAVPVAMTR
jgi:hypothetical protein